MPQEIRGIGCCVISKILKRPIASRLREFDMNPALDRLLQPPAQPVATGSTEAWRALEERLGTGLPSDFKAFISLYGAGMISNSVWILSPFDPPGWLGTLEQNLIEHREAHEVHRMFFYEPDAMIPWAATDIRGTCFWETESFDPDTWTVCTVIDDSVQRWPDGMTAFLARVLAGEYDCEVFGDIAQRYEPPFQFGWPLAP